MTEIIHSKCQCGKDVDIALNSSSLRADRKRVYHPEDKDTGWCLFRCKGCNRPVSVSVPGANYGSNLEP